MSIIRGGTPLRFHRIPQSGFGALAMLELGHAARFLEPLAVILDTVRGRPAHALVGIESADGLVGFYVVHPDHRDSACWWLGWLAIDGRAQGRGYGRLALASVLAGLRRVARCRRVRLLVDPANAPALRLYHQAGFEPVGTLAETGETVMERVQSDVPAATRVDGVVVPALTLVLAMCLRLWRRGVPPAARMSGEFHGPPGILQKLNWIVVNVRIALHNNAFTTRSCRTEAASLGVHQTSAEIGPWPRQTRASAARTVRARWTRISC